MHLHARIRLVKRATSREGAIWPTTILRFLKGKDLDDLVPFGERKR